MTVRIFVSHSSRDNALTQRVCERLRDPAGASGAYDVLVDYDKLEVADPWPDQLHEMMADCHAAVVLVSTHALDSAWVLKEATILTWRMALQKEFKLFIVQLPGVAVQEKAAFRSLELQRIQGIQSDDPDHIAARIRAQLEADAVRPTETLFEQIVRGVADIIEPLSDRVLAGVADQLDVERPPWRPGQDPRQAQVERIASRILRGELGKYSGLEALMNDLKSTKLSSESLRKLLRFTAPLWVDAEAAGLLGRLAQESEPESRCGVAAINGNHVKRYTGQMYVQRAFPLTFEQRVHGAKAPSAGDVVSHYVRSILEFCRRLRSYEDYEDAEIMAALKQAEPWLFVVIAPMDRLALEELREKFPKVRFLIHVGADVDLEAVPDGAICLAPPVDIFKEQQSQNAYLAACNIVDA